MPKEHLDHGLYKVPLFAGGGGGGRGPQLKQNKYPWRRQLKVASMGMAGQGWWQCHDDDGSMSLRDGSIGILWGFLATLITYCLKLW